MNITTIKEAQRTANNALERCYKKLQDSEKKWNNYMDLKLHDVSYFCFSDYTITRDDGIIIIVPSNILNEHFQWFCEDSYNDFTEFLKEDDISFDEIADYIGRTSKFYLSKMHNDYKQKYLTALEEGTKVFDNIDLSFGADMLIEDFNAEEYADSQASIEEYADDYVQQCLWIAQDAENELDETLRQVKAVYDYIEDFKNNQVEYFKEYINTQFEI